MVQSRCPLSMCVHLAGKLVLISGKNPIGSTRKFSKPKFYSCLWPFKRLLITISKNEHDSKTA